MKKEKGRDMIRPILKNISCFEDINNIYDFCLYMEADIGEKECDGWDGADTFHFYMVTPRWLEKNLTEEKIIVEKGYFVVNESQLQFDIELVEREIKKILRRCVRETWEEAALAINEYLNWEYYDPNYGICEFYKSSRKVDIQVEILTKKKEE